MRRSDREIKEFDEIVKVMERCDVCRLALNTSDFPYILPLSFGMEAKEGNITLYFHGALKGTKYELMERDNRASFEMDCSYELILDEEHGNCTTQYESVVGEGYLEYVPDEEKREALLILMRHYRAEDFPFNERVIPQTRVFKLVVKNVWGKTRKG